MRHLLLFLLLPLHMFAAEPDATPEAAKPPPAPHGPGATYAPEGTAFQLFSPTAKSVSVVLYDAATGDAGRTATPLKQSSDGLWNAAVTGDLKGKFYTYALTGPGLDAKREVMDPYAVNAVASSTRARIAPMSAPVRPGPKLESPTDMVIYEMSVRDLTMSPNSGVQN
ncbi:MAG: hypothetical protein ACREKL_00335, partial [Chthoniobacterales bacterium]